MVIRDPQWPVARLIPIPSAGGIEGQELRAASSLLAVMSAVSEFGRALLKPLGAPAGKIQAFVETPFRVDGRVVRPDGLISVARGSTEWVALVEVKVGNREIEAEQITTYVDLARTQGFNAIISISNEFVSSSAEYPVRISGHKLKRVRLHHWSWVSVLTEAIVQKEHRGISDPDQAYILDELIRYLSDPRSGAIQFESMGPNWTAVRDGAREGTLRRTDEGVVSVARRWDELVRYLGLTLTQELGRDVKQILSKDERVASRRQVALQRALSDQGRLEAELAIPNAAASLRLVADLEARLVTASCQVDAPRDGRSKGRVSWLLRQLQEAPEAATVEARMVRSSSSLAGTLRQVREDPSILFPEGDREIRQFVISLSRNMGLKRSAGRGSFIESVMTTAREFYGGILQNLRAWKPSPPRLKEKPAEKPLPPAAEGTLDGVRAAVEEGQEEMQEMARDRDSEA